MTERFFDFFKKQEVEIYKNRSLSEISYIGIGGIAKMLILPESLEKLKLTTTYLLKNNVKYKVVGNMSNLLPLDDGFDGAIIKSDKISGFSLAENKVSVLSGTLMPSLSRRLSTLSVGGFEPLSGIPGTIGGMLQSNAGAFGSEISDLLVSVETYFPAAEKTEVLSREELCFSYRDSFFRRNNAVILRAEFLRKNCDSKEIFSKIREVAHKRRETQPIDKRTLGSVFYRINGVSAGRLIDELGLKGVSIGDAEISDKHAGFIVNKGSATSADYLKLINLIKNRVFEKHGIWLKEEIEVLS